MNQSGTSPAFVGRHLQASLDAALADTPVVCLLGPRQCGKSTLARHQDPTRQYFSLDEARYLALARQDPEGFVARSEEHRVGKECRSRWSPYH